MRWGFFVREALRGLRRSSAPALAALLTVLLTALVLGVFIPIVQATTGTANEVRNRVAVDVYVKESATQVEQAELKEALAATSNVKSVEFISKGEALARSWLLAHLILALLIEDASQDLLAVPPFAAGDFRAAPAHLALAHRTGAARRSARRHPRRADRHRLARCTRPALQAPP